jgi:ubiquitin C-terminal hydrolase
MKGIYNIGNSCYLNSAIQLLFSSSDFRNICTNMKVDLIDKEIKSYDSLPVFNPRGIKNIVASVNKTFAGFGQEDSFEFIIYLLDYIDKIDKTTHTNLYDKFGLNIKINIKCKILKCLKESEHIETDLFLQLPMTEDLTESYRLYKKIDILKDDTLYNCDNCKKKTIARKRTIITKWPDNLIIVLKRFDHNMRKDNRKVNIPLEWRHNYKLKGGIIHMGSFGGGHYIYYGHENNNWYIANDANISLINSNDIDGFIKNNMCYSYILYYVKTTGV